MNRFYCYLRFVPVTLVMGIIFFLSHQPGHDLPIPQLPGLDKALHGFVFGVLAGALLFAVWPETRRRKTQLVALAVILFCMLYGIADEFHQSYIPGRVPSIGDVVADTLGAILLVYVWYRFSGIRGDKITG